MLNFASMGKKGKRAKGSPGGKRKNQYRTAVIAVVVLVAAVSSYLLLGGGPSGQNPDKLPGDTQTNPASSDPSLRNRLILPAWPQNPRPITLDPNSFPEPEVRQAYLVAKQVPEVLERIPCYCGCYGNSGHRNNLDCYKDSHGVT